MTNMRWSAFTHSYTLGLRSFAPHAREHLFYVGDRRLGQNAVAEIEDEGLVRERGEHVVDRTVERGAARQQHQRIEIALHRPAALDALARKRPVDHPVEPDGIDLDLLHIARQRGA